jgi:hypothetical protein
MHETRFRCHPGAEFEINKDAMRCQTLEIPYYCMQKYPERAGIMDNIPKAGQDELCMLLILVS